MRFLAVMLAVTALCALPLLATGEGMTPAKPDFSKIDKNDDGELTPAEFASCVETYPELGMMKATFDEIDVDQDGVITQTEYESWIPMTNKEIEQVEEE